MTPSIQLLSPWVASQIAAGEVIERPASVVKECLENALDAQASHITVDLSFGGLNQIIVHDNGIGIHENELTLAVTAHATSKIKAVSDLSSIQTMGFRGEALSSIASVARLTLQSKTAAQEHAMMLTMQDGLSQVSACAREQGTTVIVRDLFYNAPVRKRFLGSVRTEFLAIERLIRCFALSVPEIRLNFFHQGRKIFMLPCALTEQIQRHRVQRILGKAFMDAALEVNATFEGWSIKGWVAHPSYVRSQQDRMWVYVNRRMVSDKLLNHAVRKAYEDFLLPGRYPICLLYLDINPAWVDVNVHPTKHELRFHYPRQIHDALYATLFQLLSQQKIEQVHVDVQVKSSAIQSISSPPEIGRWIAINQQFALFIQAQEIGLVHIEKLRRDLLQTQCETSPLPWHARPLLVPVQISLTMQHMVLLEDHFAILSQFGIMLSWAGKASVIVRSIPTIMPYLAVRPFIEAVLSCEHLNTNQMIAYFTQYHEMNSEISLIEQETWSHYLNQCTALQRDRYVKILTKSVCEAWFNA